MRLSGSLVYFRETMGIIINYLFIGVVFNLIYDFVVSAAGPEHQKNRFTLYERAWVTLTWPLSLLRFIRVFINQFNNR